MKIFILTFSFIVLVTATPSEEEWITFKNKYNKLYTNQLEEKLRYTIFVQNLRKIQEHNENYRNGKSSFEMGVNKFADMSQEEFKQYSGYQQTLKPNFHTAIEYLVPRNTFSPPDFMNWTTLGAVTEAKDQGSCGSCWSFSAVGSLEGQYFKKFGKLVSFSAQNLVDCDKTCAGCHGGLMDNAFDYISQNGISTDKDYPYHARDERCLANTSSTLVKITSYAYINKSDENDLQRVVASIGPVSVAIDASINFHLYSSGILNDTSCSNERAYLNHGVLAVGYGTENGKDYWIVKNSWGKDWGENGFLRMARNADNQCGIATYAVFPIM